MCCWLIISSPQDSKGYHDRELKAAKDRLSSARKESESAEKNARLLGQNMETLKLEATELETSVSNQKQQVLSMILL